MTKLVREMSSREVRAMWIAARRQRNATARKLGFRNYREWQPNEDERSDDE